MFFQRGSIRLQDSIAMDLALYFFVLLLPVLIILFVLWGVRKKLIEGDNDEEAEQQRGESNSNLL